MRTTKKIKSTLKGLFVSCILLAAGTTTIYANETTLTDEEVRTQATVYMEKEKERGDEFTVSSYDITNMYPCDAQDYIIHDFQDGISFSEMLKETEEAIEANQEERVKVWRLPYKNTANQNCIAIFWERNGEVELVGGELDVDSTFDMKLKKGKYKQISIDEVEEVRYVDLYLYHFMVTYVRMKDGTEYMIPFLSDNVRKFNNLKDGHVYKIDKFFEQMYNYYDEPTEEDLKKKREEYEKTGVQYYGGGVATREVPLDQLKYAKIVKQEAAAYGIISVGAAVMLVFLLIKWHLEKKFSGDKEAA